MAELDFIDNRFFNQVVKIPLVINSNRNSVKLRFPHLLQ